MNSINNDASIEKETESSNDERYLVPGLIRGLAILKLFDQHHQEMTISEIAEKRLFSYKPMSKLLKNFSS